MNRNKKMLLAGFVFLFVFSFFHLAENTTKAQEGKKKEKELIMGIARNPLISATSVLGKGTADARELFESAAEEFKKKHGITLTMKIYPAPKFLFKDFQDKILDFSALTLATYLYAKNNNIPVKPLLTVSATGAKGEKYCVYAHKSSGIKNVKQLVGKRFATSFPSLISKKDVLPPKESYIYWIAIKKILQKSGAGNVRFNAFFKEFTALPIPLESVAYAVLLKKFDAFLSNEGYIRSLSNHDKSFSDLIAVSCLDVAAGAPFVHRSDVPQDIVKKFKEILLHPPATITTKQLIKEFKGIKLFPVNEKDYAVYFQWLKEAEQKAWFKEFDDIMENTPKPKSRIEKEK